MTFYFYWISCPLQTLPNFLLQFLFVDEIVSIFYSQFQSLQLSFHLVFASEKWQSTNIYHLSFSRREQHCCTVAQVQGCAEYFNNVWNLHEYITSVVSLQICYFQDLLFLVIIAQFSFSFHLVFASGKRQSTEHFSLIFLVKENNTGLPSHILHCILQCCSRRLKLRRKVFVDYHFSLGEN